MDERLRRAAQAGDTNELYNCIREDARVLRRIEMEEFVETPLHIAAARGHSDFAVAIMYLKPSFARKLNQDVYSPIHLALQNDHEETVLRLLEIDKDLVRVKGREGYTAFHYVVEKGNLDLLTRFLRDSPECIDDVTIRNETALHIATQNHRLDALEILVRWLQRTHIYGKISRTNLLNSKDRDGNTALHIAASITEPEMIQLLLECKADAKQINMKDLSALDIIERHRQNHNREICLNILRSKGGLNASSIPSIGPSYKNFRSGITFLEEAVMRLHGLIMNMSTDKISTILVGLTLVITAIFESLLSPPGGVWQGNISENATSPVNARVGQSVLDPTTFNVVFVLYFAVVSFACFTIVVILQIITSSKIIAIIAEVLVALLICCFAGAGQVIVPAKAEFVRDALEFKLVPFYIFSQILIMEVIRRICLTCKRWYHEV